MRVLFHCHGGPAIGVGHVFRASSLAEMAIERGHHVQFTGDFDGPLVLDRLRSIGAEIVDAPDLAGYDVVHVDTYGPDGDEVAACAQGSALVSNVEDGEFGRRTADLVVDPNLGAEGSARNPGPVLLRGSRWAPLRRAVSQLAGRAQIRSKARRVLVVMGGTDVHGLTGQVLDLLAATDLDLRVTAIAQAASRAELERRVADLAVNVRLVPPTPDLPRLLLAQDLVVSASGTSVSELCCIGVPTALVSVSDNQRLGYARMLERGAVVGLGSAADGLDPEAAATLRLVLGDAGLRGRLSETATRLVDGLGAWRIVSAWEELLTRPMRPALADSLLIRTATEADGETLWRWRNDPATRAASRDSGEIALEHHRGWLRRTMDDPLCHLLVASDDRGRVGTIRWDRLEPGVWEVSVTVAPDRRGQSLALPLLRSAEEWLADHEPATHTMVAVVRGDNVPSRRLFGSSGYLPDLPPSDEGLLRLVRQRVPGPKS